MITYSARKNYETAMKCFVRVGRWLMGRGARSSYVPTRACMKQTAIVLWDRVDAGWVGVCLSVSRVPPRPSRKA